MKDISRQAMIVIEDSDEDFALVERGLHKCGFKHALIRFRTGEEALNSFEEQLLRQPKLREWAPRVIVLDINLPKMSGHEVLDAIRSHPVLRSLPVIVLSTSSSASDIARSYSRGINSYIVKTLDYNQMITSIRRLYRYWYETVTGPFDAGTIA